MAYDDYLDADIHEWLRGLPTTRKAEMVRHAIRYYLTYHGKELSPVLSAPVKVVEKERVVKRERPSLGLGGEF